MIAWMTILYFSSSAATITGLRVTFSAYGNLTLTPFVYNLIILHPLGQLGAWAAGGG